MEQTKLVVLVGPTASGKTALSILLAKRLGGEIVSADSMQVYKGMDIGTAKPTPEEQQGVPHHLLSVLEPEEEFSVAKYCELAHPIIRKITERGNIPILTGGTGRYVDSVVNNISYADIEGDTELRDSLNRLAEKQGNEAVFRILEECDPEAASRLHPNNLRRVIRAIELKQTSGISIIEHERNSLSSEARYDAIWFGMAMERELLYERINQRVDHMVEQGLKNEVEALAEELKQGRTSVQGLGYKELLASLEGKCTFQEAIEILKRDTRRYAKRQMTWFRRNPNIHWLDATKDAKELVNECMEKIQLQWGNQS